jgi:hypothetical protein
MVLKAICPPALIYLVFSLTQVAIDTMRGMYNLAFIKIWVAFVFTVLLNYLCVTGLGIISWLIVFIPFILMTIIVSMLLLMFGLDPKTGTIKKPQLTSQEEKAVSVAENLTKQYDETNQYDEPNNEPNNEKYEYQPTSSGKTKISTNERKVLNDMVQKRTNLARDPLQ